MTEQTDLEVTHAYTRRDVDEYLDAVAAQRSEIEAAIADAKARYARATDLEQRIATLEQRIGEWVVLTVALTRRNPEALANGVRLLTSEAFTPVSATPLLPTPPASSDAVANPPLLSERDLQAVDRLERLRERLERLRVALSDDGLVALPSEAGRETGRV
jgi:DNA polymerase III delta prime subunit